MADIDSALTLHDLYKESMVRELLEKTKNGGIIWTSIGGNQFSTSRAVGLVTWTFFISKTQIGTASYKYNLDVKKAGATYITITDGPLQNSSRDSATKNLYDVVEMATLQLDDKVIEAMRMIQDIPSCLES